MESGWLGVAVPTPLADAAEIEIVEGVPTRRKSGAQVHPHNQPAAAVKLYRCAWNGNAHWNT